MYAATAEPASVTIGLIVGTTGCLLVDTGSHPDQGRAIAAAVAARTEVPLVGVAITHAHFDHFFGLAGLGAVRSYGHESLGDRLIDLGADDAGPLRPDPAELVAPSRSLAVGAAVDLGGTRVELAHIGRGHTEGDLVIAVSPPPPTGRVRPAPPHVIFAGDLLETAGPPWFGPDSFPLEWPATLDGVVGMMAADTLVVPGHGDPIGRDGVFEQRGQIAAVAGELQRLVEAGITPGQAADAGTWPFPADRVAACIAPAYATLAAMGVRRTRPTLPLIDP